MSSLKRPHSGRMGSERVYSRSVRRAIEREQLRRKAVEAINGLVPAEFGSWAEGVSRLNELGVRNEFGRTWTKHSPCSFVEIQMLALGVSFAERLRLDDRRSAGGRLGAVKRWKRLSPLEEVRNACAAARTREEAADILNRKGVKTGLGKPWTSERVGEFLKRHRSNVVEVLEALEPDRSLNWEIIADRLNLLGARNMNGGHGRGTTFGTSFGRRTGTAKCRCCRGCREGKRTASGSGIPVIHWRRRLAKSAGNLKVMVPLRGRLMMPV